MRYLTLIGIFRYAFESLAGDIARADITMVPTLRKGLQPARELSSLLPPVCLAGSRTCEGCALP